MSRTLHAIDQWFTDFGRSMNIARSAEMRFREIQRLNTFSDHELEKMNLRRDQISSHVFRDVFSS